jgi:F0F1-type ATP synthase assembly protein I
MSANTLGIILLSLSEIVALSIIVRLWVRQRVKFLSRLIWSVVLLVPFFGLMAYLFLHEEPEAHPYRTGDSGWNVGGGGDSGGDSGGGHGGH